MKFKQLSLIGITLEVLIFLVAYAASADFAETFKYAARYSGRLSLLVFLIVLWQFTQRVDRSEKQLAMTRTLSGVFALLHFIHLFLLLVNVKLNAVSLIPHKLAGGMLAYLMILAYPIFFERIKYKKAVHAIYFLYVGFVMAMTYIARLNGEFEGAAPELFHKVGLGLVVGGMLLFIYQMLIRPVLIKGGENR